MFGKIVGTTAGFLTCLFVIAASLLYMQYKFNEFQCGRRAKLMGLEHNYAYLSGCTVKVKGNWFPMNQVRVEP